MGKTSNGTFRVPGGFKVNNNKPIDDRFVVETDADLLVDTNANGTLKTTELYKGLIVYSEESETHYVWNGLDRTNANNWLPINGSGGSTTVVDGFGDTSTTSAGSIQNDTILNERINNLQASETVDTLEDLKAVENPQEGDVVKTKAYGDSGYSLFKRAELTIFDNKGGETVEQYARPADFIGENPDVYYVDLETNNVHVWDGTGYTQILEAELNDSVMTYIRGVSTDVFPTTGDTSKFYRYDRNVDGRGDLYRWDDATQSYVIVNFDNSLVDPLRGFPREGYEHVNYYDSETDNVYLWDANINEYVQLNIPTWAVGQQFVDGYGELWDENGEVYPIDDIVLFGTKRYKCILPHISGVSNDPASSPNLWEELPIKFCKYDDGTGEEIFEALHTHTAQLTLEPTKSNYGKLNLWKETTETATIAWSADTDYSKNDLRLFNSKSFKAVQSHYSRADLDPEVSIREYNQLIGSGLGSNYYQFIKEPVTTLIAGNTDIGTENERLIGEERDNYEFSPFKKSYPTHTGVGLNLISESGVPIALRLHNQGTDDNQKPYIPEGTTKLSNVYSNARVYVQYRKDVESFGFVRGGSGEAINVGEKLYLLDDDVTVIRPDYTGFDGQGYWKLVTPDKTHLTPADAGARTTQAPNNKPFDCRDAIQKINNNIYYPVHIPTGGWYISDSIYLRLLKEYKSDGFSLPLKYKLVGRILNLYQYTTGVIWTDKNIDVVVNRTEIIQNINFNIDCQNIKYHTKVAFKADPRFRNKWSHLDLVVYGNFETLSFRENLGTIGLSIDPEDAIRRTYIQSQEIYGARFGVNYGSSARIKAYYTRCIFWRKPDVRGTSFFTNGLDLDIVNSDFNKQNVNIERGYGQVKINSQIVQHRPLLSKNLKDTTPSLYLEGKIYVDVFPMDFGNHSYKMFYYKNGEITKDFYDNTTPTNEDDLVNNYLDVDGNYNEIVGNDVYSARQVFYPKYFIDFASEQITPGPTTAREVKRRPGIYNHIENLQGAKVFPHLENADLNIYNTHNPNRGGIVPAYLYNSLIDKDLTANEYYIKGFESKRIADNTDIDLETFTEKSDTVANANSEVTVNRPNSVLSLQTDVTQTTVNFSDNADPDNDYVEFYLNANNVNSGGRLDIRLDHWGANNRYPKKIQVIQLLNGNVETNTFVNLKQIKGLKTIKFGTKGYGAKLGNADKLIIRFIGCEHIFKEEIIEDAGEGAEQNTESGESTNAPFTGGSYIIQNIVDLPTYANDINLLSKRGGQTVRGDINFVFGKGATFEDSNGNKHKLVALDVTGEYPSNRNVKRVAIVRNNEDGTNAGNPNIYPFILTSDDLGKFSNGQRLESYLNQVIDKFSGVYNSGIAGLDFKPQIFGKSNSDPDFPTDSFFSPSGTRPRGICLTDNNGNGFVIMASRTPNGNSLAARKVSNSGFTGGWFYLWDSEHLTKAQYDSFIRTQLNSINTVETAIPATTFEEGKLYLLDASAEASNVSLDFPATPVTDSIIGEYNPTFKVVKTDNSDIQIKVGSYDLVFQDEYVQFRWDGSAWVVVEHNKPPKINDLNSSPFEVIETKPLTANSVNTLTSIALSDCRTLIIDLTLQNKDISAIKTITYKAIWDGTSIVDNTATATSLESGTFTDINSEAFVNIGSGTNIEFQIDLGAVATGTWVASAVIKKLKA